MNKVTESIFDGEVNIIPMADVRFIEKHIVDKKLIGYRVHMKYVMGSEYIYLCKEEGEKFLQAWCYYRSEVDNILIGHERGKK